MTVLRYVSYAVKDIEPLNIHMKKIRSGLITITNIGKNVIFAIRLLIKKSIYTITIQTQPAIHADMYAY